MKRLQTVWHGLAAWWKVVLALVAVITAASRIEWLGEKINPWAAGHIVAIPGTPPVLDRTLANLVAAGVILLAAILVLCLGLAAKLRRMPEKRRLHQVEESLGRAEKSLRQATDNALRIVNRLYPPLITPPYVFESVNYTITVDKNGDGWVRRIEEIRSSGKALHYWQLLLGAEPEANAVEYLEDLDFQINEHQSGFEVAYLAVENKPHAKRVAIFHLPQIEPSEPNPRKVETRYRWSGLLNRLVEKGAEDWTWTLRSTKQIPLFEFRFFYHPGLGVVDCASVGKDPGQQTLQKIESDTGWPGWLYRVENAPIGPFDYVLRFTKQT